MSHVVGESLVGSARWKKFLHGNFQYLGKKHEVFVVNETEPGFDLSNSTTHPFSAYITGLIRYDLLVGGPHTYSTGEVRSKVQRAITRKTVAARRKGGQRKILLEHLIERATGRRLPKREMEKVKAQIAQTLRETLTKKPWAFPAASGNYSST